MSHPVNITSSLRGYLYSHSALEWGKSYLGYSGVGGIDLQDPKYVDFYSILHNMVILMLQIHR